MTLREISALVSMILLIFGTYWYIRQTLSEKIKPVLATWMVGSCGTVMSFATYMTTPEHSIVSNIYNAGSILTINAILIAVAWKNRKDKIPLRFSGFQKACLILCVLIAIYWVRLVWVLKGTGFVPNFLLQVLMLIGYFITAERLWHAKRNTESILSWGCILAAGLFGLYTGIVSDNSLSILFAGRTSFGVAMLLALMYRAKRNSLKQSGNGYSENH